MREEAATLITSLGRETNYPQISPCSTRDFHTGLMVLFDHLRLGVLSPHASVHPKGGQDELGTPQVGDGFLQREGQERSLKVEKMQEKGQKEEWVVRGSCALPLCGFQSVLFPRVISSEDRQKIAGSHLSD